jgi:membrane fusion protein, multidrug efflux system
MQTPSVHSVIRSDAAAGRGDERSSRSQGWRSFDSQRRGPLRMSGVLLLAACSSEPAKSPPVPVAPISVQAVTVGATTANSPITATGVLGAKEEVTLSFKIGGVISDVRVNAGDRVRAGQTLAVLSQAEIGNEVAKARLARDKASRDLARVKALYADSVATLAQLQDATTGFDVAQANVGIAEFNQRYTVVSAPADGEVLERLVERNQLVTPGAPVIRVRTARQGMVLRVGLSDRDVARTRVGDDAALTFDALPEQTVRGVVTQVGVSAAARTGTFDVEIALRDQPRTATLASGLIGRAVITPRRATGTLASRTTIPIEALVEAVGDTAVIYTLADGAVARRRQVIVTSLDGAQVVLRDAIAAGTQVITAGAAFVVDGSPVRLVAAGAPRP